METDAESWNNLKALLRHQRSCRLAAFLLHTRRFDRNFVQHSYNRGSELGFNGRTTGSASRSKRLAQARSDSKVFDEGDTDSIDIFNLVLMSFESLVKAQLTRRDRTFPIYSP